MRQSACEYRSSFPPITKRRPLAVCLPICLPISSRKSSWSTAIRLTERPISPERWAQVILEPRRGYGRACLTGLANTQNPDVVVFLDGDYSDRSWELPILLAPIIEDRADITMGSRLGTTRNSGALPWHAAFGNRLAASLIRLL